MQNTKTGELDPNIMYYAVQFKYENGGVVKDSPIVKKINEKAYQANKNSAIKLLAQ